VKKLLVSLTIISLWSGINAAHKSQASNQTAEDVLEMMKLSKKLESKRAKVGVCVRRIAIQMAALLDSGAEYSNSTVRETIQELSDRLRQTIEKYEKEKNVTVIVYHKDCGVKDVTDDFIKATFPYPVKE
jgi:predicted transcriptional regulator